MIALPPRLTLTVMPLEGQPDLYEDVRVLDVDRLAVIALHDGESGKAVRYESSELRSLEVRFEAQKDEEGDAELSA